MYQILDPSNMRLTVHGLKLTMQSVEKHVNAHSLLEKYEALK